MEWVEQGEGAYPKKAGMSEEEPQRAERAKGLLQPLNLQLHARYACYCEWLSAY